MMLKLWSNNEKRLTFLSNFFSRLLTCFTFTAFLRMTGLKGGSSSSSVAHAWERREQTNESVSSKMSRFTCSNMVSNVPLPCCCQAPLPCTAGRDLPRCRSHRSTVSVCGTNCPSFLVKRVPHPSHAAFSVKKNNKKTKKNLKLQVGYFHIGHKGLHKHIRDQEV